MAVYLDWNATAPPLPAAVEAMVEAARDAWANPASIHGHGRTARAQVERGRAAVAALAGCDPRDVVLTSGGTEANNLALRSLATPDATLLVSRLEHPSITRVAEALEREGGRVVWLEVRSDGVLDLEGFDRALAEAQGKVVVALQAVNHETGVVQPVAEVIARAHARSETRVHVDAVQAFGRLPGIIAEGADTRSLAGHKIRGPKGIGALILKPGVRVTPVLLGGAQERGLRPGTVDPVAAAGLAVAADHARSAPEGYARIAPLRDRLEAALLALALGAEANGAAASRAPHVTNVSFPGWNGAELVAALDLEGVSVSSGSACSAGTIEPSPVLTAMLGPARARSAVRLSLGEETTAADVDLALAGFHRVLHR